MIIKPGIIKEMLWIIKAYIKKQCKGIIIFIYIKIYSYNNSLELNENFLLATLNKSALLF